MQIQNRNPLTVKNADLSDLEVGLPVQRLGLHVRDPCRRLRDRLVHAHDEGVTGDGLTIVYDDQISNFDLAGPGRVGRASAAGVNPGSSTSKSLSISECKLSSRGEAGEMAIEWSGRCRNLSNRPGQSVYSFYVDTHVTAPIVVYAQPGTKYKDNGESRSWHLFVA